MSVNPYRVFPKRKVTSIMSSLNVDYNMLTGLYRKNYKGRTILFDTFDTLSDPVEYFAEAMNTELEHGKAGGLFNTDVTKDDALKTAKIAVAHLKGVEYGKSVDEFKAFPSYYDWLWWMEKLHEKALERN